MEPKKTVLIVGGTGGIGSEIVKIFHANNFRVYATYFSNEAKAKELCKNLPFCKTIKCDMRNEEEVQKTIDFVVSDADGIDVFVNSATPKLKLKLFETISSEEFFEDISTILLGTANFLRKIVPIMKKKKAGTIINIISEAAVKPLPRMTSYSSAKAGLLGLLQSLSQEVKAFNIKIVSISPSFVETSLLNAFPQKLLELEREKNPKKAFIKPEEIARAIFTITSNQEKYMNGDNIVIKNEDDLKQFQ